MREARDAGSSSSVRRQQHSRPAYQGPRPQSRLGYTAGEEGRREKAGSIASLTPVPRSFPLFGGCKEHVSTALAVGTCFFRGLGAADREVSMYQQEKTFGN